MERIATEKIGLEGAGAYLPFGIVAVGASAGGLEAYRQLVQSLPADLQQAYVLVQHLDPTHESLLPELLSKHARIPVSAITDGMRVEPGRVYLIPAGYQLRVEQGELRLSDFETPRGQRRPIDTFFESLARERGAQCAAVVLSGTGSDGSTGLRAVKEAGGLVIVQDPDEAKYDGMPTSAIDTNTADFVLAAGDIAQVVAEYFDRRRGIEPTLVDNETFVAKITQYVRYRTGHDFSQYKRATLMRRILRRMTVLDLRSPGDYIHYLITHQQEAATLHRDLLINVTGFFRDPDVFTELRRTVIPKLIAGRSRNDEVRIWVPGCSSGQEAYSLAMLLCDEMEQSDIFPRVRIFATDIDDEALHIAREGAYPPSIADELSEGHLGRYFTSNTGGYRLAASLREMVRVSNHNLIKDPPFSKIDLVSCRNLLIYFNERLQRQVTPIFHYALRPEGFLLLGPAENILGESSHFVTLDARRKIYRRDAAPSAPLNLPTPSFRQQVAPAPGLAETRPAPSTRENYQQAILDHHAPPYVVIDAGRRIVFASARTGRFLELPPGAPTADLIDFAKGDLKPALRALIASKPTGGQAIRHRAFSGTIDDREVALVLSHQPLDDGTALIVFQDRFEPEDIGSLDGADAAGGTAATEAEVRRLEHELADAHQTIRTTVEELETSNEELKSSNEEMMSMNEELQSANEELSTINEELQNKITELNAANDDIRNLISASELAIIFLDGRLRVRNFTAETTSYFRFDPRDIGRPIEEIHAEFDRDPLLDAAREVLADRCSRTLEFRTTAADRDVSVHLAPYLTSSDELAGVVLTFTQVTELREYARNLEKARREASDALIEIERLYRNSPGALALLDRDLRYVRVNERLAEFSGAPLGAHAGRRLDEVQPTISRAMIDAAEQVLATGEPAHAIEVRVLSEDDPPAEKIYEADWFPAFTGDTLYGIGLAVRDVTRHKAMEAELRRLMRELQHRVKNMLANVTALINQAQRQAGDTPAVMETLSKRIRALANTHNLLTATNWRPALLKEILAPELTDIYGNERVHLVGPPVRLNARATLGMSMVVHELSTNAAKYGSLSQPGGTVEILWQRTDRGEGEKFIFEWIERGGPAVSQPTRTGYGSDLIDLTVRGTLGGTIDKFFELSGFRCVVTVPIEKALGDGTNDDQSRSA